MKEMNSTNVSILAREMREAAIAIANKYGLKAIGKAGSYDPLTGEFNSKVQFKIMQNAEGKAQEQVDFERFAPSMGLQASDFKRKLRYNAGFVLIVGVRPSRPKFGVLVEDIVTGKRFLLATEGVIRQIKANTWMQENNPNVQQ